MSDLFSCDFRKGAATVAALVLQHDGGINFMVRGRSEVKEDLDGLWPRVIEILTAGRNIEWREPARREQQRDLPDGKMIYIGFARFTWKPPT